MILDLQKAPLPAIFAYGFRPFFLSAGCYAVIAMGCWLAVYAAGASPPTGLPPQLWHAHEMVFGFVAAAIAGFLLTAVPSWTGRQGYPAVRSRCSSRCGSPAASRWARGGFLRR